MAKRVFVASVKHESHSFCIVKADMAAFRGRGYHRGDAIPKAFRGTRTELGAVFDAADRFGWSLIHPLSASAMPAGPVTEEAYEHFCEIILGSLKSAGTLDGILLVLHGAMICEHVDDAEGDLLARVRAVVGPDLPIAITLDLHANVTDEMARLCNIMCAYRTTPHVDMYETGERAAGLLEHTMEGEITPRVYVARRPMLNALDDGRTIGARGPMIDLLADAARIEASDPEVLTVAISSGFPWADIEQAGATVAVTSNGWSARAVEVAERLIEEAWRTRSVWTIEFLALDRAMQIALKAPRGKGPLLIGDYTDCPAGGPAGDGTNLLKAMIEARLPDAAFGVMNDAEAAAAAHKAGVGATLSLSLGGKKDPRFGGLPLPVTAKVLKLSDGNYVRKGPMATGTKGSLGPSALLDVHGIRTIVASGPVAIDDREQFRILGIQPEQETVLACKAMNHFRADYEAMASGLIYVDSGGSCSQNFKQFPFRKLRRPISPLDFD